MKIKNKLLLLLVMLVCGFAAAWAQQQQQHVTVAATEHGTVTVDNSAPYSGETVHLTVTPDHGYKLANLQVTCNHEGNVVTLNLTTISDGHYAFTMPDLDVTVTATFEQILYTVTVEEIPTDAQGFGVGFVMVNSVGHSDNRFAEGETVSLLSSADIGYELTTLEVTYKVGDEVIPVPVTPAENNNYTFVMPAADVYVHWIVAKALYTITFAKHEHGVVSADKEVAQYGEEVTLQATTDEHYILTGFSVKYTNGYPVTVNGHKFIMPATNVIASAIIEPVSYNIAVQDAEHGTVTAPTKADYGTSVEVSVSPAAGYKLGSIKVVYTQETGEVTIPLTLTESGTYTFTMPGANVRVVATFEPIAYNITVAPTEHGTVTAPKNAQMGAQVSVTATPDRGYEIDQFYCSYTVEGEGADQKHNIENGTFTMPATDVTIVATFKPATYNITVAPVEHGTVSVPANAGFDAPVEFTVKPDEGYRLGSLKVIYTQGPDETEIPLALTESGTYTFTMPEADVTVLAAFEPQVYNIATAIYPDDEAGTIQVAASAAFGSEVEVVATPAQGYILKDLYYTYYVDGGVHEPILGIYNGKFNMPATDVTVVAMFEREQATQHNIAVSIDIVNGNIEADKSTAAVGETVTLTVTPDNGYMLETITVTYDDGTVAQPETGNAPRRVAQDVPVSKVDDMHYTFQMPAGSVTVNATFIKETTTGISDVNAATGAQVRYFDLQGRYIGTTLDRARSGIYVTGDGRKVIK